MYRVFGEEIGEGDDRREVCRMRKDDGDVVNARRDEISAEGESMSSWSVIAWRERSSFAAAAGCGGTVACSRQQPQSHLPPPAVALIASIIMYQWDKHDAMWGEDVAID